MIDSNISIDNWSNSSVSSTPLTRQSSEYSLKISDDSSPLLDNAIQNVDLILSNQTKALSYLTSQFRTSQWTINQMKTSLRLLNNSLKSGGKIIISGMGKSFKIASKTVATLNSLRMHSALLHPSEALHGDLGMIREDHNDSLIIISASGNSPELLQMLEHVPISVPIILMTCNKNSTLAKHKKVESLILAEIPLNLYETNLYGLSAPTITTTLCLTLLDSVAIALSELHINDYNIRKSVFSIHHPGGAIGINHQLEKIKMVRKDDEGNIDESRETITTTNIPNIIEVNNNQDKHDKHDNNHNNDSNDNNGNNGNENSDDECLDISELVLIKKVQNSKYKTKLESFPLKEGEFLKLITLNDFVIISEVEKSSTISTNYDNLSMKLLDCEVARDVYRDCQKMNKSWSDSRDELITSCVAYSNLS